MCARIGGITMASEAHAMARADDDGLIYFTTNSIKVGRLNLIAC